MHYSATGEFVKNKETFTNTKNVKERFQNQSSSEPDEENRTFQSSSKPDEENRTFQSSSGPNNRTPEQLVDDWASEMKLAKATNSILPPKPPMDGLLFDKISRERYDENLNPRASVDQRPFQSSSAPDEERPFQSSSAPREERPFQSSSAPIIPPGLASQIESTFIHGGVTYIVGQQGIQGERGSVGLQGPQGVQGPQGGEGLQGPQGKDGPQGVQGPQGPQGFKGDSGPQGFKGPQGDQGLIGPNGKDFDPTIYKSEICIAFEKLSGHPALKGNDIYFPNFCGQPPYGSASAPAAAAPAAPAAAAAAAPAAPAAAAAAEGFRNVNGIKGFDSFGFNYSKY